MLKGGIAGVGEPPMLSVGGPEGTNMVFRTSRRPLFVLGFRGVAACCACCEAVKINSQMKVKVTTHGSEGVCDTRKGGLRIWVFFPYGLTLDIELETQLIRITVEISEKQI